MPDVEPLRYPSREGPASQPDLDVVSSGRRRTCALLNSPSPYVSNAICHMQELKTAVENWCQQCGQYRAQFDQEKQPYKKFLRFQPREPDSESVMSELFVEGVAISARETSPLSSLLRRINDVLGEVMCLIERLEADRQFAEEALLIEKQRKKFLENKVDRLSLWKQQECSSVVQKAHEACVRDMSDLKIKLKLEKEKLHQVQKTLSDTEMLNHRLQEDINFAKKQIPIVKENLDLQDTKINQINTVKAEAEEMYLKAQSELLKVQNELKVMEDDASNEKALLDDELQEMKNQLAKKSEDLNQLEKLEEDLNAEIVAADKTVALTEEMCATLRQRIPELTESEKNEKDQISVLKVKIQDEMQKNKKLSGKIGSLEEAVERSRLKGEAEVSCIKEQLQTKRCAAAALRKESMEYEQKVEEYERKTTESEKAVAQMRAETKQMLQKIIDSDEQWEKAKEEVTQIVAKHSVARAKLQEQEKLTFQQEQKAREIESLKKDLTGQITALELLKDQCADLKEELERHKISSELTNHRLQKEFENVSSATKALETKIKKIKKVTEDLENIQQEHRNTLLDLEREKKLRHQHLEAAQDLHTATVKRYEETQHRIADLMKKTKEYQESSDKMEQIVESMPGVIEELQSVFDSVDFQYKSAVLIMSTLQADRNECQQRTRRSVQTHTAHVRARKKKMAEMKELLQIALKENKQLAKEYESMKKSLMKAKQEDVSAQIKRNSQHGSFLYYKQLSLLQKRMHKALVKYFKRRSLYSQAELDRCQALSQETKQKIKTAQESLSDEIHLISAFLRSLTDDSTTTEDAAVDKQGRPDAAGSK
ncbi:coiled-coil domain-containing protein 178 isoform X2 [Cynoglossus semilaevis]|uniref:coiled-coil domain-containing protein 178 isoform X2 n=1 Tax=Cynoglossus semilaevis TaxID=244447 RepID=UPI000D62896A|nr:coiled-coil domain-containing protein 178 isoform X2 [Cynoglossus semilaevis]